MSHPWDFYSLECYQSRLRAPVVCNQLIATVFKFLTYYGCNQSVSEFRITLYQSYSVQTCALPTYFC